MEDPQDVVVGAGAIAFGIGAQAVPGVGTFIGAIAFSYGAGKLQSGLGLGPESQKEVTQEVRSTENPVPLVYGTTKVGTTLADLRADPASAGDQQFLIKAGAFAVGSENGSGITDVEKVWLDEELAITDPDLNEGPALHTGTFSGLSMELFREDETEDFFAGHLRYSIMTGRDDQLQPVRSNLDGDDFGDEPWLKEFFPDAWSEHDRGRGLAYAALVMRFDQEVFPGIPTMQLLVKGNRVYDPRNPTGGPESDGFAHSNNPWLVLLDYLTSVRYGIDAAYSERDGGDVSEIDEQSFIDAANHADELVPYTKDDGSIDSHKRHTFDSWLPTTDSPEGHKANITRIVQSTGGMLVHQSGKWRAVPKRPTAAVDYTLDESNIIGDWSGSRSGVRDAPSRIRSEFTDASRSYQTNDVHWPATNASNPFRDEDNDFPSTLALQLPGVTNRARAQRMAQVALKEARADKTFQLRADESALQLQVGDVVPLKHPTPGYTDAKGFPEGKKFWIHAQQIFFEDESLEVGLTLREYDPDAYVTELGSPPEEPGDPVLPNPVPGPIDADLIGAWLLGFGGCHPRNCNPGLPCEPCLQCADDERRIQHDFSGHGNGGTIDKSVGFAWASACPSMGPAGVSFLNGGGGFLVNVAGSLTDSTLQLTNPEGGDGFTAMAWFYSTSPFNTTANFGQSDNFNNEGWNASIDGDGAFASFGYYGQNGTLGGTAGNAVDIEATFGRSVGQNEWVHFAVAVHPSDGGGNFLVDFFINGQWVASRTMTDGPIVPATTGASLGWGAERGDNPSITRIVGKMNQGLIYDGALSRQDVSKVVTGETLNPTPGPSFNSIDDIPEGNDFGKVSQDWLDDGRPLDWLNTLTIDIQRNNTCSEGSGLRVDVRPDYTTLTSSDEGDYRVFVDWFEDGVHVHQDSTTNLWGIGGQTNDLIYSDSSTGSDAGDATEHFIRAHVTLLDITGTDPVALDSKSAAIRATYGFSC